MDCGVIYQKFGALGIKNSCLFKDYPKEIPQTFAILNERMNEIPYKISRTAALYEPGNQPESDAIGTYYASALVEGNPMVPDGMVYINLDTRQYAWIKHKGKLSCISDTYKQLDTWIVENGHEYDQDWIIELYNENFNPTEEECELEIYMPIKET